MTPAVALVRAYLLYWRQRNKGAEQRANATRPEHQLEVTSDANV